MERDMIKYFFILLSVCAVMAGGLAYADGNENAEELSLSSGDLSVPEYETDRICTTLIALSEKQTAIGSAGQSLAGFKDNGDGSITDLRTGLVWLKNAGRKTASRKHAAEYCDSLTACGYSDWRLPTVKEFNSMIAALRENQDLRTMLCEWGFIEIGDFYWTQIKDAPFEDFAWSVDSGFSPMSKKENFVLPVRGGRPESAENRR
jgi:hypothetical protein